MAIASAKAAPKSIGTKIGPDASGFRPIDSIALLTILPMAKAGRTPPRAMVKPLANTRILA